MRGLTIGQVAKHTGITRDAIRLYEQQGLIEEPQRAANGYRLYSEMAVARLRFIQRAKAMGFTLKEISELLAIKRTATNTCEEVRHQAETKLVGIKEKLIELNRLKQALEMLILTCDEKGYAHDCPLLEALEHQDQEEKL